LLAMLGWNDGTDKEIFTLKELISSFSVDRISKAGAKFDFEKAKWYNHEWIKNASAESLQPKVASLLVEAGIDVKNEAFLLQVIDAIKDRCNLLGDFVAQSGYFFTAPTSFDEAAVKPKWSAEKADFFNNFANLITEDATAVALEDSFKALATEKGFKPGELMLPLRVMLVGGKFGPGVFDIAVLLGATETKSRIEKAVTVFNA
ncbi:MAG: glutamate--tRNA ligase, partial [Chitinophagaceae bacterium]